MYYIIIVIELQLNLEMMVNFVLSGSFIFYIYHKYKNIRSVLNAKK